MGQCSDKTSHQKAGYTFHRWDLIFDNNLKKNVIKSYLVCPHWLCPFFTVFGISMFKLLQYGTITAGVKATVSHYVILVFKACFGIPQETEGQIL